MSLKWMSTGKYLIVHYGENKPCVLEKGSDVYTKVVNLLALGSSDEEVIRELDLGKKIEDFSEGTFSVDRESGVVSIDGVEVRSIISKKIVLFCKSGLPYFPLVSFWRNIQQNPSEESKEHLYLFLEANNMPITHDGCFLAYKKVVRDDEGNLVDAHSKTFCNNVGAVVTMPRENVNTDRNTTCSTGLHVAAFDYAANSYSGTDLLEVKVNPRDVVAVPNDYQNQKMRVCRYEVVGINNKGPLERDFLPKEEVRAKKKLGEKTIKGRKLEIKEAKRREHDEKLKKRRERIESLKVVERDDELTLSDLTASEVIEVVEALTGQCIKITLKDKKRIVKKAKEILIDFGFDVWF